MEKIIKTTEIIKGVTVNVPKQAKTLAKFVGFNALRNAMQYVCINLGEGLMCATDAHKLQALRVDVRRAVSVEDRKGLKILLDPKHVTKVAGKPVTVSVTEEVRERENGDKGTETRTVLVAEMVCNGETYRTEITDLRYPNVMQVLPVDGVNDKAHKNIRLTGESVEALKAICRIEKRINIGNLVFAVQEGSKVLTVGAGISSCIEYRSAYTLELAEASPVTCVFGLNAGYIMPCIEGFDGVISLDLRGYDKYKCVNRSVLFGGVDGYTLIMPFMVDSVEDDKEDTATLQLAEKFAKSYASDSYYCRVRIFFENKVVREYENGKAVKVVEQVKQETPTETQTTMNEQTKAYYRNVYGTYKNLCQMAEESIKRLNNELQEYTDNHRKGGRERKRRIGLIRQNIRNLKQQVVDCKQAFA